MQRRCSAGRLLCVVPVPLDRAVCSTSTHLLLNRCDQLRVRSGWRHKAPRVRIRSSRDIYRRVGMLRRAGALTSGSVASNAVKIGCDTHALVHRHVRAAGAAGSGPGAATASCIRSKHTAHSRARGTEAAAARMGGEHRMHARLMVYRLLFPDGGNERAACAELTHCTHTTRTGTSVKKSAAAAYALSSPGATPEVTNT